MAFQVSPGVLVQERDVSLFIPQIANTAGAFVGSFAWGPCEEYTLIDSEQALFNTFGRPNNDNFKYWYTAANFLAYGNNLQVNRLADSAARNSVAASTAVLVRNDDNYDGSLGYTAPTLTSTEYVARYPGILGNNLKVSVCDYNSYSFTNDISSITTTGAAVSALTRPVPKGSWVEFIVSGVTYRFQTTADAASGATSIAFTNNTGASTSVSGSAAATVLWEYWDQVESRPSNSRYVLNKNSASSNATIYDELHIVIADEDGGISGTAGTILEKWVGVSKASDAVSTDGGGNYYVNVINTRSNWIRFGSHVSGGILGTARVNWGSATPAASTGYTTMASVQSRSMSGGVDVTPTDGLMQIEYLKLANAELFDVSLIPVIGVAADNATARYVLDNVAESRRDCVVFVSPTSQNIVDATAMVNDKNSFFNKDSTYAVVDSAWKYQYDRYNDVYRWLPLAGDIAGLCARTDQIAEAWFSPGGYTRGQIKNVVKLNWTPGKTARDLLYRNQINPVVTQPGLGTLLFGDKTCTQKPSAFDRINVRRLFIVLEKTIATAAKFQLFEFNDDFTRSQFRALVEPFLRDVQGRRGIIDFRVVCDDTNNTAEVIDRNDFVADIYIKPARSINFITLNFVATRSGISFEEIGG
jgi:hypothetical protein